MSGGDGKRQSSAGGATEVERLRRQLARAEERIGVLEARLDALRNRRSVRLALALADRLGALERLVRRRSQGRVAPPADEPRLTARELGEQLERKFPPSMTEGPLVSIIVLTHDGWDHLERLLCGLRDTTAYRTFEVIVVDNASSDGTASRLESDWGFALRVVRNEVNVSFSAGCNQAARLASGRYLLLLNDDVAPAHSGWLGAMVGQLEGHSECGVAGAVLIYADAVEESALSVQHRGVAIDWVDGAPRPYNLGAADALSADLDAPTTVPAVTGACLLVAAETYRRVGGLDERYVFGLEDVDFCLRLGLDGLTSVVVGGARLFHEESATQRRTPGSAIRTMRMANRRVFSERWSSDLQRAVRGDALEGRGFWSGRATKKVAITITEDDPAAGWGDWYTGHELGGAFAEHGWEVVYAEARENRWRSLPPDVGVVVGLLDRYDARLAPGYAACIAWVRNWTERWAERDWLGRYDVTVPSSTVSQQLLLDAGVTPSGVHPLATNPARFSPQPPTPAFACDYTFTGHYWGASRALLDCLDVRSDETFTVFGRGWDEVPQMARYWRGPLPYVRLPELYSSARIVLDDTAGPTLPYGAVNSRVFDALACGAVVITNHVVGSGELFDGELPTYTDRRSLRQQLDRFLGDDELRSATAASLRARVLSEHTYIRRAGQMIAAARAAIMSPRVAIRLDFGAIEEAGRLPLADVAHGLSSALRARGWHARVDGLAEFDSLDLQAIDVALHLRIGASYVPKAGHLNAVWLVDGASEVSDASLGSCDAVFVSGPGLASRVAGQLSGPVSEWLPSAAGSIADRPGHDRSAEIDEAVDTFVATIAPLLEKRRRLPGAAPLIPGGAPST